MNTAVAFRIRYLVLLVHSTIPAMHICIDEATYKESLKEKKFHERHRSLGYNRSRIDKRVAIETNARLVNKDTKIRNCGCG